ncbi:MAG: hypothetical protein RJA81_359, partial [Planctomycetota bacterium]
MTDRVFWKGHLFSGDFCSQS